MAGSVKNSKNLKIPTCYIFLTHLNFVTVKQLVLKKKKSANHHTPLNKQKKSSAILLCFWRKYGNLYSNFFKPKLQGAKIGLHNGS